MQDESDALTWILRFIAFFVLWGALCSIFGPLQVAADCIPFIGPYLGQAMAYIVPIVTRRARCHGAHSRWERRADTICVECMCMSILEQAAAHGRRPYDASLPLEFVSAMRVSELSEN